MRMELEKQRATRICALLESLILTDCRRIRDISFNEGKERSDNRQPFADNQRWGGRDTHCRFYTSFRVPQDYAGKRVDIKLETGLLGWDALNPQFMLYINDVPVQGMDVNHTTAALCYKAVEGDEYRLEFEAYSGMVEALSEFRLSAYARNNDIEHLYYNLKVPLDCLALFDENDKKYTDIANHLNAAINLLDLRQELSKEFFASIAAANNYMEDVFYGKYCAQTDIITHFVGHTHIDVAWLWRVAQTEEKAERSFATMLSLMAEYPEFIFSSSQPQLYKFVKKNNPALYERIKERIQEGRWEPEGAMWLEADTNISSGESLVRQIMHGKRFFKEEFGKESELLWLPDVFGYSAALPQILRKSGVNYFVTSKISWNEYNRMPYDAFVWKGIDSTSVLTSFITTKDDVGPESDSFGTYNGKATANQILGGWNAYKQKDINSEIIAPIGYGDGGGGTTRSDLEMARRMAHGIPGLPTVKMSNTLDYMKRLESNVKDNSKLPEWVGELYLEYHRGTYTSMARNKRYNRKSEIMLHDAELYASIANELLGEGYPADAFNDNWETVLLNQFHDILPGSSIKEVYEDSLVQYEQVKSRVTELTGKALDAIAGAVDTVKDSVIVFNPTGYERDDLIDYDGRKGFVKKIPASGYKAVPLDEVKLTNSIGVTLGDCGQKVKGVSTKHFEVAFDGDCNIIGIIDKRRDKQVLNGKAVLQAFEDLPLNYDAWDINIYYRDKMWEINDLASVETQDLGAALAVTITRKFLSSTIKQRILFYDDVPRIDFDYEIDWKEKHILLKAAFPVAIHSDKATYDIQFGNLERPNHWNTSWDKAKFEVCAHKWADLSQDDYGVSLLNDCKYGYDIKGNIMRLTLLKSADSPNPDADREKHYFTYSLYPHSEGWRQADTPKQGYFVNYPLFTRFKTGTGAANVKLPDTLSMVSSDKSNCVIETIKKAEDGNGYIFRIYDCYNREEQVNLTFFKEPKAAWECGMLENNLTELIFKGKKLGFKLTPYEIKTVRVVF